MTEREERALALPRHHPPSVDLDRLTVLVGVQRLAVQEQGEHESGVRRVVELERLQLALTMEGASTPSLADGGVPVADIASAYPKMDWDAVCGEMFLEP